MEMFPGLVSADNWGQALAVITFIRLAGSGARLAAAGQSAAISSVTWQLWGPLICFLIVYAMEYCVLITPGQNQMRPHKRQMEKYGETYNNLSQIPKYQHININQQIFPAKSTDTDSCSSDK